MNFTNAELLKARERKMARFSPKFNTEGDRKKRSGAENQAEGAQAPKRRRLVKGSSAGSSNPGVQPTAAAVTKGKKAAATAAIVSSKSPTDGTSQLPAAEASAVTVGATEPVTVTAPDSAAAGTATAAASKSATIGATTTTADQPSTAGTNAAAAATSPANSWMISAWLTPAT
ncbi:uncharacterized protein LOC130731252 [Lotus japonicus]|uniref:uncharacterized protein LOC130731252 n=1 Tax=Lotus japonicus TaxID=34305 RepID=UPI0025843D94|nr:uncharacterized protein LOC130731252 [Lotus japonicus]